MEEHKRERSYLIWLLSRKDYPRRQLEEKLRKREVPKDAIKKLLDQLIDDGWYNEGTFKKVRTRQLIKRGYGPSLIKAKLGRERLKVDNEEIAAAYEELGTDAQLQIIEAVKKLQRRYLPRNLDKRALDQKIIQALLRKGFNVSAVLEVINKLKGSY
jgi:SOS response regulatory protein OraA/RecX